MINLIALFSTIAALYWAFLPLASITTDRQTAGPDKLDSALDSSMLELEDIEDDFQLDRISAGEYRSRVESL